MVIRILTGKDVAGAVSYNEKKVLGKQADRLLIANYPVAELARTNARFRLDVLQQYARLNPDVSKPSLHLAVAFHPSESLSPEKLQTIGQEVMQGAGFGRQPYLVYQHHDTAHPHLHIVSVSVDAQGNRINDSFLKNRLQQLRRKLEVKHQLMPAEKHSARRPGSGVGEGATNSEALSERISRIIRDFTFGSLDSFGQFLQTQRIHMNPRAGRSRSGITFQAIDEKGVLSRAVKASALPGWPARARLHRLFASGVQHRKGCHQLNTLLGQQSGKFVSLSEIDFYQAMREVGVAVFSHEAGYLYVHQRSGTVAQEQELAPAFSRSLLSQHFSDRTQPKANIITYQDPVRQNKPDEQRPDGAQEETQKPGKAVALPEKKERSKPEPPGQTSMLKADRSRKKAGKNNHRRIR